MTLRMAADGAPPSMQSVGRRGWCSAGQSPRPPVALGEVDPGQPTVELLAQEHRRVGARPAGSRPAARRPGCRLAPFQSGRSSRLPLSVSPTLPLARGTGPRRWCWWPRRRRSRGGRAACTRTRTAAHASVLAAIAVLLGSAVVGRRGPPGRHRRRVGPGADRRSGATSPRPPRPPWPCFVWIVLVLAAIGWDLNSFVHQSHDLPTLSSIFGHVTSSRAGRAAVFALWLTLGAHPGGRLAATAVSAGRRRLGRARRRALGLGRGERGQPRPARARSRSLRWFAQSWLGRALALCAWAGAGWHLFCQRP